MADPVETVVDPNAPSAPEPPAPPSIEQLQQQLVEAQAQNKLYKDTLAALGTRQESPPPAHTTGPPAASAPLSDAATVRELAQELGYPEDQIGAYLPLIRSVLRREAAPALNALYGVADRTAQLEARLTVEDWKDIEQEAVKVATEYRNRGVMLGYKDAADIARSRMAPELAARRAEAQQHQQQERAKQAAQAGEPIGTQKAGPTPTKQGPKPKTRAEIERLPPEERRKALDEILEHTEF